MDNLNVCVIGAGTAGLSALKNSLENQLNVICYEQSSQIGGVWVYTDVSPNVHDDCDIHSSMYQGLRTNLPKEVMGYLDFPYPQTTTESFVSSQEHEVIRVKPRSCGKWEVHVRDKLLDKCLVEVFDCIFICNGHYTKPQYPQIDGMDIYKGCVMHSHLYREPLKFQDTNVLIVGAGPSGMDITNQISKTAKRVYLSHHLKESPSTDFMGCVTQKPDVKRFTKDGAIFMDDSEETFSYVIFCTGYQYSFPFLSIDCGVHVTNNHVQPLYRHIININYPTMAFIGLPFLILPTQCFDLQVRFALKFFTNKEKLPSQKKMLDALNDDMLERRQRGLDERNAHKMAEKQFDYFQELSEVAGLNIKPVIAKIMKDCGKKYIYELETYRRYQFKILDDDNFLKICIN
ncbi:flavin-containing monooxygenase 2 isoform X2 [Haematobia irritans]|uniref:flavin-containing monooxygenase 2 isoform X2 n=1 Tax=Haematobia irritans TaxID=7368 RepID=UPI003F5086F7